jgi:hypothetical protein
VGRLAKSSRRLPPPGRLPPSPLLIRRPFPPPDLLVPNHGNTKSKPLNWLGFPCAALSLIALRSALRYATPASSSSSSAVSRLLRLSLRVWVLNLRLCADGTQTKSLDCLPQPCACLPQGRVFRERMIRPRFD